MLDGTSFARVHPQLPKLFFSLSLAQTLKRLRSHAVNLIAICFCFFVFLGGGFIKDCLKCNAKGRVACPPCDSYGQIRCYISLTITWKANTSEHIVAKCSSLPEDLIRQVSGQVVYEEEGPRIPPLNTFADPTINLASAQLVLNHNRQWPDQRILAQVTLNLSPPPNLH